MAPRGQKTSPRRPLPRAASNLRFSKLTALLHGGPSLFHARNLPAIYSVITWSAHSTSDTKIGGLPNFAPKLLRSASVTPRAREHAPHA